MIQLDNVKTFSPNDTTDPEFSNVLRLAKDNGVDIMAYNCIVERDSIELNKAVEIIL